MEIKTSINLSAAAIGYIFCGAFEGGSNYWMQTADLVSSDTPAQKGLVWWGTEEIFAGNFSFKVGYDDPDSDQGEGNGEGSKVLTQDDVAKGLQLMATKSPSQFADLADEDNGNPDACTYDVAMQYIVLGDVIYG